MSLKKIEARSDFTSDMKPVSQKRKLRQAIESLSKTTHFDKNELEKLSDFYGSEECFHSKLTRSNFLDFLHKTFNITDLLIMDQIFRILDQDGDGCLNLTEFSKGMSLFLRGTFEETSKFCFDVYDINGDGFISKEEVSQLLKKAIIRNRSDDDPDETFKELVELAIKKLDKDSDHKVSRSDFEKATSEEKLLMQCLGKCLPDRGIAHKFEKALFHSR